MEVRTCEATTYGFLFARSERRPLGIMKTAAIKLEAMLTMLHCIILMPITSTQYTVTKDQKTWKLKLLKIATMKRIQS